MPATRRDRPEQRGFSRLFPRSLDATAVLTFLAGLLLLIPATQIVGPLGASGTPAYLVGILLLIWWTAARWVPALGVAYGLQPIRVAMGLFAASLLVTYAMSSAIPRPQALEASAADRGMLKLLAWAGIALVAADGIRSRARLETLIRRIVVLAAVLAAMGLLHFWSGIDVAGMIKVPGLQVNGDLVDIERSIFRRPRGTATHPIEFGVILAAVLPLALHVAVGRGRSRRRRDWLCLGLIAVAAPTTISRSAVVGLLVGFLVLLAGWNRRQRRVALMCLPVFVIGLRLAIPGLVGTLRSLFTGASSDPSVKGRTEDYAVAADYIGQHPWFGRGFGTFLPELYTTFDNQYLLHIVEAGVVGLAAILLLFAAGWCSARGARLRSTDPGDRHLGQALAASIASVGVTFATFDALSFPMVSGLTFLLLGCAGAAWRLARAEHRPAFAGPRLLPSRL